MCTIRRSDSYIYAPNNECIRVSISRSSRGEVKLGEESTVVIDEIMDANNLKGEIEIDGEVKYRFEWVWAIVPLPNFEDIILTFCEIRCAIKASDVDQAGNGTIRTTHSTLIVARKTTVNSDSRIFP